MIFLADLLADHGPDYAFHSATGGTFQTDTDGTNHSDIPGTFESDMGGTFKVLQSSYFPKSVGSLISEISRIHFSENCRF